MSRIEDLVPASEAVIWRWPNARRYVMVWAPLVGVIALSLGALAFTVWVTETGLDIFFADAFAPLLLICLATAGICGGVIPYLLLAPHCRYGRFLVTGQSFVARGGISGKRSMVIQRDQIETVTLYEGDNTLVLHGHDGELFRERYFFGAAEFLDVLQLPATVWPRQSRGAGVAAVRFFGSLLWILVMAGALAALLTFDEPHGNAAPFMEKVPVVAAKIFLWLILILTVLPVFASFAATALARIALKPESYAIYVHSTGPLWEGMDPQARAPLYRFMHYKRQYIRFCARLLGGVPGEPPALEPKHREPRIPMATVQP